jgi:hypothetical protein
MERDPLPPEIEEQFLEFVDKFHAEHNYERNFRVLAQKLNIAILNELWKKAILKNLLKAKDLKMSD